jgi:hypothetical protein
MSAADFENSCEQDYVESVMKKSAISVFKAWESIDFFNEAGVDPKTNALAYQDEFSWILREEISNKM